MREGAGCGADYHPWLPVGIPSRGEAHRIRGAKTRRAHHVHSNIEQACLYLLDWSLRVIDTREQFPLLPLQETLAIAAGLGVAYDPAATARILAATEGYPYFLQEWGKHAWDVADDSPITLADVDAASVTATAALDESFFRVRFDRLTPSEKRYLRAMAELGPGPHRSGDIAMLLGRKVTVMGPTRSQLIAKGMVWSPSHGDTAFTVPMFDQFMRRIMPGKDWMSD